MPEPGDPTPTPSGLGTEEAAELEALGSQAAYEAFLAPAQALEASAVEECRADIALACYNVKQGVEHVLAQEAVVSALPGVKLEELRSLPQLAQGLAFAALQVHRQLRAVSFRPLFEQALRARRKLLKAAEALAAVGLLPEDEVSSLSGGRQNVVEDCLALTALLKRHEASISGRSPVTAADLEEAEQVATNLRQLLAPWSGGESGAPAPVLEASGLRNRFWTLLKQRYEVLWRCGAWLFGHEVEEHVPPLESRRAPPPQIERAVAPNPGEASPKSEGWPLSGPEPSRLVGGLDPRRVRFIIRVGTHLSKL
ncbi:hypothetical protein [Hyalangium rubrum]|uniref:Uncharacterized protein n=1 Tax=Hyalangium rubrum TaxID=3103134 RepID=A0ABU5HF19_9BACT|nr:hypothetical protein [Hyalangium sp. s54d21]MDY7231402.1 hypothetical protein [Hyalangium sp. s54d21]